MEHETHQHPVTMQPPEGAASTAAQRRYREVLKVTLIGSALFHSGCGQDRRWFHVDIHRLDR